LEKPKEQRISSEKHGRMKENRAFHHVL